NRYTTTERTSFSATLMSGMRMFKSGPLLPTASHRLRWFEADFRPRPLRPWARRHARRTYPGRGAGALPRRTGHGRRDPVHRVRLGPELFRRRRRLPAPAARRADAGPVRAWPRVDARAGRARGGRRMAAAEPSLPGPPPPRLPPPPLF